MNAMTSSRPLSLGAALLALGMVATVSPAAAQEDARWLPYTGCWVPVDHAERAISGEEDTELLCVSTNAQGGVDMRSYQGTELLGTVTVTADEVSRAVEREGCSGTETARFSDDRRYITVENQYVCEGGVEGRTSGLMAMVTPFEWINAQVVEADDGEVAGVMRYTLAGAGAIEAAGLTPPADDRAQAVRRARVAAAQPLNVDDIIAASADVHPQALQAWIVEQGDLLPVNSDELLRMAEAGVSEDVIDMTVAISHPTRFAIQQGGAEQVDQSDRYDRRRRRLGFFPGSFGYLGWTRYSGYGYGYGFSPYPYSSLYGYEAYGYGGYGYGGYGYGGYGYRPIVIPTRPAVGTNRGGRAVRGRGYTRGSSGSTGGVRATQSGGSSGSASARSRGSSGSSSRTAKPRTAKRRGGGF